MKNLVYSTGVGRRCGDCGEPVASCCCAERRKAAVVGDGAVRVVRETAGRKGAGVTVVRGLPLTVDELQLLARDLKRLCGVGGSVKEGAIELQGEQRDRVVAELQKRGFSAKRGGG